MKIALIGNMNNNFSAFCRYLRDEGFDAHLFLLNNEPLHFHPESDDYSDSWKKFTQNLSWGSADSFNKQTFYEINDKFKTFDICIGCDYVPAFFQKSGLCLDIFIPYGMDLYEYPFFSIDSPIKMLKRYRISKQQKQEGSISKIAIALTGKGLIKKVLKVFTYYRLKALINRFRMAKQQRRGILKTSMIFKTPTGGLLENALQKLQYRGQIENCGVPMIYWPQYSSPLFYKYALKSEIGNRVQEFKKKGEMLLFHNSRHSWKNPPNYYSQKANNYLFEALAIFVKENPDAKLRIVTFEYGPDVCASKILIHKLKIEKYVTWLPLSKRKDLMVAMSYCDAVVGEIFHSYFSYGVIYESMVSKKMVIHNRDDRKYISFYPNLYPMISVNSISTVYEAISYLYENPDKKDQIGNSSFDWFKMYLVDKPIEIVKSLAEQKTI